ADEILDVDLAARRIEDRVAMTNTYFTPNILRTRADRVTWLEDRDGDGRADVGKVFADGWNDSLDGIASSVLARKGDVYLTNIPSLWLLRDRNRDGVADQKRSLSRG